MTEGVIKFNCEWQRGPAPADCAELIRVRRNLFAARLIGVYPDGTGYGNISLRAASGFIISGSQTGMLAELGPEHFTCVVAYDLTANSLRCEGPIIASSESLTHAAVYAQRPDVGAVIHVHDAVRWRRLSHVVPTTAESAAYGTPEMAFELQRLAAADEVARIGLVVMAGHEDGLIAFGATLDAAEAILLRGEYAV